MLPGVLLLGSQHVSRSAATHEPGAASFLCIKPWLRRASSIHPRVSTSTDDGYPAGLLARMGSLYIWLLRARRCLLLLPPNGRLQLHESAVREPFLLTPTNSV